MDGSTLTTVSSTRVQAVKEQILSYEPDIVGLQEDDMLWVNNFNLGSGYTRYGWSASSLWGNQEACAIWVKSGLSVKANGCKSLTSEGVTLSLTYGELTDGDGKYDMTADELTTLGITNQSSLTSYLSYRLMNYVVLRIDGEYVIYVNTHLQHRGHNNDTYESATAKDKLIYKLRYFERCAQMEILQGYINALKQQYGDKVIITGDFNDNSLGFDYGTNNGNFYSYVTDTLGWIDTKTVAFSTENCDTWNSAFKDNDTYPQGQGYVATDTDKQDNNRIDYCFVSEYFKNYIVKYDVGDYKWTTTGGAVVYPSDHLPVIVDISLK